MSRVNLLPSEVRRARREAALTHRIRFMGVCAGVLLLGLFGIRSAQLYLLDRDLRQIRAQQGVIEANVASFGDSAAERDAIAAGEALASQLLVGDVAWSQQLLLVARAVPPGVVLSTLSGQITGDQGVGVIGAISFTAVSDQLIPAEVWLLRLEGQEGWANGWVTSAVAAQDDRFTISGSVDLTVDAISPRGRGGV